MMDFQFLSNFVLIIICFVMTAVFYVFSKHQREHLHNYRISLQVLALAYFCLAVLNSLFLFGTSDESIFQCLGIISITACSLQTMLFALTLVTLYNPKIVTRRLVFFNLLPIVFFVVLYCVSYLIFGDVHLKDAVQILHTISSPTVVVRLLFYLFSIFQLVYYSLLFFKEERIYKIGLENYYSDLSKVRLAWVRYAFFSSLCIGVLALLVLFNPSKESDLFFTLLLLCFYFVFAIKYINYGKVFIFIDAATTINPTFQLSEEAVCLPNNRAVWKDYKQMIMTRKDYLKEGVTLEDMAQCLKIGRTSLSNYINSEENMNYNSWINSLRIEEAKSLFLSNPEYTISQVANFTGYTEQSNFTRHFKSNVGTTPSEWRKNIEKTT